MRSVLVVLTLAAASLALAWVVTLRIGAEQFNWASPWLFLLAVATTSTLLLEIALRAAKTSAAASARVRLLAGTSLVMLFAAEAALRYGTPRWATYAERNGGVYVRQFTGEPSWFRAYVPGASMTFPGTEYTHTREINPLGLTGDAPSREKPPGEYRILAMGDSFTEGLGTSADATWVKVVEARLGARYPGHHVTSFNAGISGNDAYSEQMMLREKLLPFRPDLIILAFNTSDINEIVVRGGQKRFRPDGTVAYRNGPWWEPLYGLSYIGRSIAHEVLGYNFLLIRSVDVPAREREAATLLGAALLSIRDVCRARGIHFVLASHPHAYEIVNGHYGSEAYDTLVASLEAQPDLHFIDLLKYYTGHGIITKETAQQFYWPLDMHHNTKGYQIMGEAIAANVVEMGVLH